MSKTTVLFVCSDNALLGPLAEAYFNNQARGLVRAFSAGLQPGECLHPSVPKLLSTHGVETEGLTPKSLDVFLMPHAPIPDRVICLSGAAISGFSKYWGTETAVEMWQVADTAPLAQSYAAGAEYFRRIRIQVDRALNPELPRGPTQHNL